jgi:hypothetical protein
MRIGVGLLEWYVFLLNDAAASQEWYLLGADIATNGAIKSCPMYATAQYAACVRDCSLGKECMSDGCGGTCGCTVTGQCCSKSTHMCVNDRCTQCVSSCQGLGSQCCTSGPSCLCDGACPGPC